MNTLLKYLFTAALSLISEFSSLSDRITTVVLPFLMGLFWVAFLV
jgi:hypothetical protein